MDNSTVIADEAGKLNICSCCFESGYFKDISAEYQICGRKEVYGDMLRDTFNVQIYHENKRPSSGYICEECITKLKEGTDFKRMVLENQEQFLKALDNILYEAKDAKNDEVHLPNNEKVKTEPDVCVENYIDIYNDDQAHDDFDNEDDEVLTQVKNEMSRERNTRLGVVETQQEKPVEGKDQDELQEEKDRSKIIERRGKAPILRKNSLNIISNSTVCVFQWNKSRYRCFCCKEPFSDIKSLREHTNSKHNIHNIEKRIISQHNCLVKVEISNLFCKICNSEFFSLNILKKHLREEHKVLSSDEDLLVPFKIQNNGLECQICSESFSVFRLLNIHMNKHYQSEVCYICGAGFSNLVFLNLHKSRLHRTLRCSECDLVFTTKREKKSHDMKVHGVRHERKYRFPCPYCKERFYQENLRVLHLVEKHGMTRPEYECSSCRKSFVTRSLLNNHIRNVHMKEKNHKCDICNHLFYNKSDVARHKVTHTGEKNFSCTTCSNNFATKDSLRRHIKRTHSR